MTMHSSNEPTPPGDDIAIGATVHEAIRKAIACCVDEDKIVLSISSAMALIMEWDNLQAKP